MRLPVLLAVAANCALLGSAAADQIVVPRVEQMPRHPRPYVMRDWARVARDYDAFVFDPSKQGEYLPLLWWDGTRHNYDLPGFGLPSYVGMAYQTRDDRHEAINCLAAVVGASLVGEDKRHQHGHDFVAMCQRYFSRDRGLGLYLNNVAGGTGGSFWYETYPSLLFAQLLSLYPNTGDMEQQLRTSADRMSQAIAVLAGGGDVPNFNHTAFSYESMHPVDNGMWAEPDAAAGYAWFEYMAYVRTGEAKYLEAADRCLRFLDGCDTDPFYEAILPLGATLAARMNAELGRRYDVRRLVAWSFGPTTAIRPGWGVIADRWGQTDVSGLTGSTSDGGGYAFAMNTYDEGAALTPLARYDDRFARALGRYMLNLANSARLFFPNAYSDDAQNSAAWARRYDPASCIGYEGCRKRGRRHATAEADLRTAAGRIVSGDCTATRIRDEAGGKRYEVLEESVAGDHEALDHVWTLALPPAVSRWLAVDAHCEPAGDADKGFRFSYATDPNGPYTPVFTVDAVGEDRSLGASLPCDFSGKLYVRVEDTDRTPGRSKPDRLLVDALYVIYEFEGHSPFGMGDVIGGVPSDCGTDLGLYGSSHVGYLGGIVATTNVEGILRLDLLKTDWYHAPAYPTYLYYNPHGRPRTVELDVGPAPRDLYDTVTDTVLVRGASGVARFPVPPDSAVVTVVCPAGGKLTHAGAKTLVDGVVVDYSHPTITLRAPTDGPWVRGRVMVGYTARASALDPIRQVVLDLDGEELYRGPRGTGSVPLDTTRAHDGRHRLRASVETAGGAVDLASAPLLFGNGVGTAYLAEAPAISAWPSFGAAATAVLQGDCALLTVAQGTWGALESPPFAVDFDRKPVAVLEVRRPDPSWWAKIRIEGQDPWYVQGDTNAAGIITLDLVDAVRRYQPSLTAPLSGKQTVRFIVGPAGRAGARVGLGSLRVLYER